MTWKVKSVLEQRERFALESLAPRINFARLCREYGISRKTGYKWRKRFKERGLEGLRDRSRRPERCPKETTAEMVEAVVRCRVAHETWGPKKIVHVLGESSPSERTIARILERTGLSKPWPKRPKASALPKAMLSEPERPNDLWTVDFKGWWRTQDETRCEPLTVRDGFSRYLLCTRLVPSLSIECVEPIFAELFNRFGLPSAIRSDNGNPFANTKALAALTKLSAGWIALGIRRELTDPGKPQQNGGHERMHLDLAREVESRAAVNVILQQEKLEQWRIEFNEIRPHEALGFKTPSEVYRASSRRLPAEPQGLVYPSDFEVRKVRTNGSIKYLQRSCFVSEALAGWPLGLEVHRDRLRAWFADVLLGQTDIRFETPLQPVLSKGKA